MIDTHAHIDGNEFDADRAEVIARAKLAGVSKIFLPAIDLPSSQRVLALSEEYPSYLYPMLGLHPEEVKSDWEEVLSQLVALYKQHPNKYIAIGEVGLDFYWSREYEQQQLAAFETQVEWSVETQLPLMIHCRKGQQEMVRILHRYEQYLPGGVFHCFTGNEKEAAELLQFSNFVLGIGGVLTFKKSHLPEVLPQIPLNRIVLETDSPYMAPVPKRGERNESSYVKFVLDKMAACYDVPPEHLSDITDKNVCRIFHISE